MSGDLSLDMLMGAGDMEGFDELSVEETLNKLDKQMLDVPTIKFEQDSFVWEDFKLEDTETFFDGSKNEEIPDIVNIMVDEDQVVSIPSPTSSSTDCCDENDQPNGRKVDGLLKLYQLDDDKLGDMTLKKLKSLCHSTSDYNHLKSYRRTCLNRHYARSSRTKQQNKTSNLATMLKHSQHEVSRLQQENEMKDATIRCLQLELEIMRSLKK